MRPEAGIRARWAAVRADQARAAVTGGPPDWVARRDEPPDWIAALGTTLERALAAQLPRSTGGHRASTAEKRAAYALFAAKRNAVAGLAGLPGRGRGRGAVFASMRDPGDMSPLARRIFGAGQ